MALYRLIARFTDHIKVYEPGELLEWDGVPSKAMVPVEQEPADGPDDLSAAPSVPAPAIEKRRGRPPKR